MAQRRMFSKDITENDAFLDMPLSSQALYFHLGMQADDDGFVSPHRIMRMVGCQSDDLKLLIAKKFVIPFDDGIVVIKHWRINNYLRNDRYKPTKHIEKKALLLEKDNGSYAWYTNGIPLVAAGKVRIGKIKSEAIASAHQEKDMAGFNRQGDDTDLDAVVDADGDGTVKDASQRPTRKYPNAPAVRKVFQAVLGKNPANWKINATQLKACENLYTERGLPAIQRALEFYQEHKDEEFCPLISSPSDLDAKWTKLASFKSKQYAGG